ncbi:Rai14 [Symbiodinium natans]|uniref:Rai14 protein n=1 Tax=Symbiodinium natans TaxID=878477 RepID=A0A812KWT9_9DINO|nr:Rai14 [Symbiodinium natans]
MAHHLVDSVPKHLRFSPGGGSTRNLLLRNISTGDLPLRIEPPGPPFTVSVGSEHLGKNFVLEAGATLAFRIAIGSSPPDSGVACDFLTVHIECSPPLLIDVVSASDATPSDEIASLIRASAQQRSLQQSSTGNTPEAVFIKPGDAEEQAVPAALLEFLGEEPSAAALRNCQRTSVVRPASRPDTPDSGRGAYPDAPPDFDDRPPTPSPEGFQQLPVPPPRPQACENGQVSAWEEKPDEGSLLPQTTTAAVQPPEVAPTAHLTPAEATRIAAMRAKGLLQESQPRPSNSSKRTTFPTADTVEPPRPAGYEEQDLFYVAGAGWCDIYGRAVGATAVSPTSSAKSSPARAARIPWSACTSIVHGVACFPAASAKHTKTAALLRPPMAKAAPKTRDEQQAAWDAIPGV